LIGRTLARAALAAAAVALVLFATPYAMLRASLPRLDGSIPVAGVGAPVTIERDALGVATVRAATRTDLAFGTGFAHGQDRFFQMDLARRLAAGELSELVGAAAVAQDRQTRLFRFRHLAQEALARAPPDQRALLEAYARGVNAGLESLGSRPWEYWLLRASPAPWKPEDSFLVAAAMWWDLQYGDLRDEMVRRVLEARLHGPDCGGWKCALEFLYPARTRWDAPNVTDEDERRAEDARDAAPQPVPDPQALDVRGRSVARATRAPGARARPAWTPAGDDASDEEPWEERSPPSDVGSNSWAIAGRLTASGAALVASDMHLSLRVPPTWYRVRLRTAELDLNGLTLPGAPVLVAGSNGHVAWALTNSGGYWLAARSIPCLSVEGSTMRTPTGGVALASVIERIHVRGGADVLLPVRSGPAGILFEIEPGERRCWFVSWLAESVAATNMNLLALERATSVRQAFAIAPAIGIPHQNLVVGDRAGHIGWTIAGRIPVDAGEARTGGAAGWRTGGSADWRTGDEAPRLYDPPLGRVWSANARATTDATALAAIGGEEAALGAQYTLGARARQIRDALLRLDAGARPRDMLRIQLDDRAVFLARWRDLILGLLDGPALAGPPSRAEFRRLVASWDARAGTDSVGYRLVRAYRDRTASAVWRMILSALEIERDAPPPPQFEQPLWTLVTSQPLHMLSANYPSWRAFLLAQLDGTAAALEGRCGALARCRWGAAHPVRIRHPLSGAVPILARLIDLPGLELPGDHDMPRVQSGAFGASERFAVSPGREAEGYLELPGGQSDHPLSPYYRAGFRGWVEGDPLPFLPGPSEHRLTLQASGAAIH